MWTDPVVKEIHQIRHKMLAEVGGGIHAFTAKIRAEQAASGRVVINNTHHPKPNAERGVSAVLR